LPLDPLDPISVAGVAPLLDSIDDGNFQWFDTEEIDEFARSIAANLSSVRPPQAWTRTMRRRPKRLRNTHHAVFSRAEQFARTHKLNIYRKRAWAINSDGR